MIPDELAQAVLAREDVARYLRGPHAGANGRERVFAYLEELRTTQRYRFYRALQHPLYPILRKIERHAERVDIVEAATKAGRVIYASNHKSHTDYLIEPLVLDDNGIRPPIIAAGINLFGGPLGLIHKHVTGAIPIRRATKDPAYLVTLKAYVGELLRDHDLLFYPEGGRSYSGELKQPKTGLIHAAMMSELPGLSIIPTAISYDLVLEDHILARQRVKRSQRPFRRELAEMFLCAVGYRSRAFVTFGRPIPLDGLDPQSRRDVMEVGKLTRQAIGKLVKVLPTSVMAAAISPSISRPDLEARADAILDTLRAVDANLGVSSGRQAIDEAAEVLEDRGVIVVEGGRFRVRDRHMLKYYARMIEHLMTAGSGRTH